MGCLGSKEANVGSEYVSKGGGSDSACALDGPPDFGVDEMYEVRPRAVLARVRPLGSLHVCHLTHACWMRAL